MLEAIFGWLCSVFVDLAATLWSLAKSVLPRIIEYGIAWIKHQGEVLVLSAADLGMA